MKRKVLSKTVYAATSIAWALFLRLPMNPPPFDRVGQQFVVSRLLKNDLFWMAMRSIDPLHLVN